MKVNPFDKLRIDGERNRTINYSIFKSYDIRGIYPEELNEEMSCEIGRAFAAYNVKRVVVGYDMRLSSKALLKSLARGLNEGGVDVYNVGEAPTELVYFALGRYNYDAGIMITASHNPKKYNGFKMLRKDENGIQIIRGRDLAKAMEQNNLSVGVKTGTIKNIDIWQDYLKHIFLPVEANKIKPLKVVLDANNGMAGKTLPLLLAQLPIKTINLNFTPDGNFPAGAPNPLLPGATDKIGKTIRKERADFGFIFDGDADRIFLIDEKGNFVKADLTLLLMAKYCLGKNPGSAIAYNVICSKAVPQFIKKWGGRPIRTPVGFVNVREGMIKNNGVMGGELSGHYCFKDNFYLDSGFLAFLILLQIISQSGKKVSKLVSPFEIYSKESEINFEIKDKETALARVKEKFSDAKQDYLDGVTAEYDDWWFNLRPSNTEPLLRLTIEADNKKLLEKKKRELIEIIKREE